MLTIDQAVAKVQKNAATETAPKLTPEEVLVIVEATTKEDGSYDVTAASYQAWLDKAALASGKFDAQIDGQRADRSQIHEHCLQMAARYAPVGC